MNPKFLVALFPVLLSSCLQITYQDVLIRASLEGPIPHFPVHTPPTDTGKIQLQASAALSVVGNTSQKITILNPDQADDIGNTGSSRRVDWRESPLAGSGEVSGVFGKHLRLFAGLQGDLDKKAGWMGVGYVMGRSSVLEADAALGRTTLARELLGRRNTTVTETCRDQDTSCIPNSTVYYGQDTTTWDRGEVDFLHLGLTWSAREHGPWLEYGYTNFQNITRTVEGKWLYDASNHRLGAGWTFALPIGRLIAGGRVETMGDELVPSLVTQWTGELSLD